MGSKKKLVVVFEFEEEQEFPDEPPRLELSKLKLGKSTTLTAEERSGITESWGQSDTWHVDIHNDLLRVMRSGVPATYEK
jgi:hypothetical protein